MVTVIIRSVSEPGRGCGDIRLWHLTRFCHPSALNSPSHSLSFAASLFLCPLSVSCHHLNSCPSQPARHIRLDRPHIAIHPFRDTTRIDRISPALRRSSLHHCINHSSSSGDHEWRCSRVLQCPPRRRRCKRRQDGPGWRRRAGWSQQARCAKQRAAGSGKYNVSCSSSGYHCLSVRGRRRIIYHRYNW